MDPQKQKEQFNYAYVCALAAHAGLNRVDSPVDDDSIDVAFKSRGYHGRPIRSPQIEFQLKCSAQQNLVDEVGGVIKYKLSRKNYDDLRGDDFAAPRYLAVLLVPAELEAWIAHNDALRPQVTADRGSECVTSKDEPPLPDPDRPIRLGRR